MNPALELRIVRSEGGFATQLSWQGRACSPPRLVTEGDLATLRHVVDGSRQLLKSPGPGILATEAILAVGVELFHLWLAPDWDAVMPQLPAGQSVMLAVTSDVAELVHLPWEALVPPEGQPLGLANRFGVQRRPFGLPALNRCRALSPGPLRLLFMACSPQGFDWPEAVQEENAFRLCLPEEREQDPDAPAIEAHIASGRGWADLEQAIHQWQPHVIHLSGPALIRGTQGFFAFEEPDGQADARTSGEMVRDLLRHSGAGLMILSGRESGKAPPMAATGALAQGIVATGAFSMALAWPETLLAGESIPFLRALYRELAAGTAVDRALTLARRAILPLTDSLGRPGWSLATLHARGEQPYLFHAGFRVNRCSKPLHDDEK
ncbi:MAG: CHAT domain-containing protein [Magnetococcales bacterium]|nr:CHAT domain-containing protein [Magnetococcales bacterium]